MRMEPIKNANEFKKLFEKHYQERVKLEEGLAKDTRKHGTLKKSGFCLLCEKETLFLIDFAYSNGTTPNYRERLICEHCGLNNRQRFCAYYALKLIQKRRYQDIYLYEQVTGLFKIFSELLNNKKITGSEYLGHNIDSGKIINGIRHEDALNMSFQKESLDLIISNDVYEHVPNPKRALKEAHRTLKTNGILLFSIPFYPNKEKSEERAKLENGNIRYCLPEQYHGNPISSKGSLVFTDFGWDVLSMCEEAGFKRAEMLTYYDEKYGHIGDCFQHCFRADK
ncbi:MAG: class I SAM-dependent methyltransferase [bacterium]|nr:class I SAM-dependent methyltransferase [bacterium]